MSRLQASWIAPALAILAGLLWIGHLAAAFRYPLGSDPSIFQYLAFLMDAGITPYVDVIDMNTPGIILLHWAWAQVAGLSDGAWIGLSVGLSSLALVGASWSLRARVTPIALLLGVAAGIWAFATITPWDRGQRELIQGVLLLGALGAGGRAMVATSGRATAGWALLAGLLGGVIVSLKFTTLFVLWVAWAAWLIQVHVRRGRTVISGFVSMLALVLPVAGVLVWLDVNGALQHFWLIQTTILPAHAGGMTVPITQALMNPLCLLLLGLGVGAIASGGRHGAALLLLGLIHLAVVLLYLAQRHGWTYHLHLSVPLILPTAALLADRWLPETGRARLAALVATGLILLRVGLIVGYDHTTGLSRAHTVGDHWNHDAMETIANQLRGLGDDGTVLTNDDEHQLLLMAGRLPATPFLYGFLFSESHPDERLAKLGMARVDHVHRAPPRWVVWNEHPYRPELDTLGQNPTLEAWVEASCQWQGKVNPYVVWYCPDPSGDTESPAPNAARWFRLGGAPGPAPLRAPSAADAPAGR